MPKAMPTSKTWGDDPMAKNFKFTLQFDQSDEKAKRAAEFLNSLGHKKSKIVAEAICIYLDTIKNSTESKPEDVIREIIREEIKTALTQKAIKPVVPTKNGPEPESKTMEPMPARLETTDTNEEQDFLKKTLAMFTK
jgi:hypothetical protein